MYAATIETSVFGGTFTSATGEVLTAPAVNAFNSFERPNDVKPVAFNGFKLQGSAVTLNIPAKSVVILELK